MTRRTRATAAVVAVACVGLAGCSTDDSSAGSGETGASPTARTEATAVAPSTTSGAPSTSTDPAAPPDATTASDGTATNGSSTAPTTTPSGPNARFDSAPDAAGYAALLSSHHAVIVDPAAPPAERAAAGAQFQLVLRSLADRPELDVAVIGALDPAARPTVERIIGARQFLQARSASRPSQPLPTELPAWTVVAPEPVETLLAHYAEAESLTGIPWYWLAAIHLQETRMGRIQGVSSAGAVGPMQFLPSTWEACCTGDPTITRDAIIGAATYLAQSGGPDDMAAAVYQYNPNDGYVAVVTAYADSLDAEPELYPGYHGFQVFYGSSAGTVRLPIGYAETAPTDAAAYLAANPADAAS